MGKTYGSLLPATSHPLGGAWASHGARRMKLYLIVARGKHKGMPIEIKGDLFLIGAKPMCQLRSHLDGIGEALHGTEV